MDTHALTCSEDFPFRHTFGMDSKGRTTTVPQENGVIGAMPLRPMTPLLRQNLTHRREGTHKAGKER
jgi:hypothetical protein